MKGRKARDKIFSRTLNSNLSRCRAPWAHTRRDSMRLSCLPPPLVSLGFDSPLFSVFFLFSFLLFFFSLFTTPSRRGQDQTFSFGTRPLTTKNVRAVGSLPFGVRDVTRASREEVKSFDVPMGVSTSTEAWNVAFYLRRLVEKYEILRNDRGLFESTLSERLLKLFWNSQKSLVREN